MATTPADRLIDAMKAHGLAPDPDRPTCWQRIDDPTGPDWFCITVDLAEGSISVAGTPAGHAAGSRLRDRLRPLMRRSKQTANPHPKRTQ